MAISPPSGSALSAAVPGQPWSADLSSDGNTIYDGNAVDTSGVIRAAGGSVHASGTTIMLRIPSVPTDGSWTAGSSKAISISITDYGSNPTVNYTIPIEAPVTATVVAGNTTIGAGDRLSVDLRTSKPVNLFSTSGGSFGGQAITIARDPDDNTLIHITTSAAVDSSVVGQHIDLSVPTAPNLPSTLPLTISGRAPVVPALSVETALPSPVLVNSSATGTVRSNVPVGYAFPGNLSGRANVNVTVDGSDNTLLHVTLDSYGTGPVEFDIFATPNAGGSTYNLHITATVSVPHTAPVFEGDTDVHAAQPLWGWEPELDFTDNVTLGFASGYTLPAWLEVSASGLGLRQVAGQSIPDGTEQVPLRYTNAYGTTSVTLNLDASSLSVPGAGGGTTPPTYESDPVQVGPTQPLLAYATVSYTRSGDRQISVFVLSQAADFNRARWSLSKRDSGTQQWRTSSAIHLVFASSSTGRVLFEDTDFSGSQDYRIFGYMNGTEVPLQIILAGVRQNIIE